MKNKWLIIFIIIIGFLVYANSLLNGFVWDDEELILNNPAVHSLGNFLSFFKGSTFNSGGAPNGLSGLYYKPLMTVSFALLYNLFGPQALFFHLFQLTLHLANAVLVFLLFFYLFKNKILSFVLSVIFLVHPINTEAVVYIADLQEVLFLFFGLLAFYLTITTKDKDRVVFLVPFLFLLSLLSKETGAVLLAITVCFLFLYQKRKLVLFLSSTTMMLFGYAFLRFVVAGVFFNKHGLTSISTMPFWGRIINIPKIIYFYLQTYLWPQNLAINQQWAIRTINFSNFYQPLIFDLMFFCLLLLLGIKFFQQDRTKFRLYLFFFLWFVIALGFHLQIFPLDLTVSDRWFYLPQIGLLGIIGVGGYLFFERSEKFNQKVPSLRLRTTIVLLSTSSVLILFSFRTFLRTFDWRNGLTLYSHDEKLSPNAFDLENNLGVELFRIGQIEQAKIHFEKSIELSPKWWTSYNNLGAYYERTGNLKKAEEFYKTSIKNGKYYLAYENLVFVYLKEKKYTHAISFLEKNLPFFPYNIRLNLAMVLAYYQNGDKEKALVYAKRLYQLSPTQENTQLLNAIINQQPLGL